MKLELTEGQAGILRPLIRDGEGMLKQQVVIAQVLPGDWQAPEKLWLIYSTITKDTAKKIRKLIEKEHAQKTESNQNRFLAKNLNAPCHPKCVLGQPCRWVAAATVAGRE